MNRNRWPPSIGTAGRNPSEWVAGINGIGSDLAAISEEVFLAGLLLKLTIKEELKNFNCFAGSRLSSLKTKKREEPGFNLLVNY